MDDALKPGLLKSGLLIAAAAGLVAGVVLHFADLPDWSTAALATGTLAIGVVLGGLTGLLSAVGLGRLGSLRPAASTALVALLGAVSFSVAPFLKYPATPPAVGSGQTIDSRTALRHASASLPFTWMIGMSNPLARSDA